MCHNWAWNSAQPYWLHAKSNLVFVVELYFCVLSLLVGDIGLVMLQYGMFARKVLIGYCYWLFSLTRVNIDTAYSGPWFTVYIIGTH